MRKKKVLVTNANHDSGAVVLRVLRRAGFDAIGADFLRLPMGIRSRYANQFHLLTRSSQAEFAANLLNVVRRVKSDIFLPIDSISTLAACKHRKALSAVTVLNIPEYSAFMAAYQKQTCISECKNLNIPCPDMYTYEEALSLLKKNRSGLTLVVKPNVDLGAARGVFFVRDAETLTLKVRECTDRHGGAMIQEYIPGGVKTMRTVFLLFSRESRLAAAFTTQKVRQWPLTGGATAVSRSTAEVNLIDQVLPFFRKWHWSGAAEVELKFDSRTGEYKLIEINPRFPAYLRFAVQCGLDIPAMAVKLALNEESELKPRPPAYSAGQKYLNPGLFIRAIVKEIKTGGSRLDSLSKAMEDLQGCGSTVVGMLSDPMPLFGRAILDVKHVINSFQRSKRTTRKKPEEKDCYNLSL